MFPIEIPIEIYSYSCSSGTAIEMDELYLTKIVVTDVNTGVAIKNE